MISDEEEEEEDCDEKLACCIQELEEEWIKNTSKILKNYSKEIAEESQLVVGCDLISAIIIGWIIKKIGRNLTDDEIHFVSIMVGNNLLSRVENIFNQSFASIQNG